MTNSLMVQTNITQQVEPYTQLYDTSTLHDDILFSTLSDYVPVEYPKRALHEIVICGAFLLLITLTSFVGNAAVIYAVISTPKLHEQNSNLFIINLAITDMFMSFVVITTSFVSLVADIMYIHPIWCNVVCAANYIFIIVSMLTLAFISADRYVAVLHPLSYIGIMTRGRILVMISYAWFQGIIFIIPPVILHWNHYDYWEVVCAINWHYEKLQAIYYVITACIVCFLMPGIVMIFCYFHIIHEAKKSSVTDQAQANYARKRAAKTIRSLLIVVLLFFICLTPFCLTKFLKVLSDDPYYVPPYANLIASYFAYMSSVVNPFIYAIFRSDFRSAYRRLFWNITFQYCGTKDTAPRDVSFSITYTQNHCRVGVTSERPVVSVDIKQNGNDHVIMLNKYEGQTITNKNSEEH